jgi:hypothetical protein
LVNNYLMIRIEDASRASPITVLGAAISSSKYIQYKLRYYEERRCTWA